MALLEEYTRLVYIAFIKNCIPDDMRDAIGENKFFQAPENKPFPVYLSLEDFITDMSEDHLNDANDEGVYFNNINDVELWEAIYTDDILHHSNSEHMVCVDNIILLRKVKDIDKINKQIALKILMNKKSNNILKEIWRKVLIFKHILLM